MSSVFQTAPAIDSALNPPQSGAAGWSHEREDVPLGCECADPALQIDCWDQETFQPASPCTDRFS